MASWWRNPWNFVRVLCGVSGLTALGLGIFQLSHSEVNLSFVLALPVALFTASFSASIGMWLYSHITEEARDAQFRFERIYTPLYDEFLRNLRSLNECNGVWLPKWQEFRESSLKEFIPPKLRDALDKLQAEFETYDQIRQDAYETAHRIVYAVIAAELGDLSNKHTGIANEVESSVPFLLDPDVSSLHPNRLVNIKNALNQAGIADYEKMASTILTKTKAALLQDEKIDARVKAVKILTPKAESMHQLLYQRLMRPLS
jgi:hypothetical protein